MLYVRFLELFSTLHVFFLDLNSLGPDDGPVRTETCSPTANKVYAGHLLLCWTVILIIYNFMYRLVILM